jgi:hypothetical protein
MTDTNTTNALSLMAAAPSMGKQSGKPSSWFEAMAEAWGRTLDAKAAEIEATSDRISNGEDKPAVITQLSAQTLQMSFLSNSSHNSMSSVGSALEALARKQ